MGTHRLQHLLFFTICLLLAGFITETRIARAAEFTLRDTYTTASTISTDDRLTRAKPGEHRESNTLSPNNERAFMTSATVTVTKKANPISVPETGGVVTFTITVTDSTASGTLSDLTDSEFGDLDQQGTCTLDSLSTPYRCEFTRTLAGTASGPAHQNTVTATVTVSEAEEINTDTVATLGVSEIATDTATVTFTDIKPDITVSKTASPTALPEPGGNVTFTFAVTNTTAETVTLDSLTDTDFGDLNEQGSCAVGGTIAPGQMYSCQVTEAISGNYGGPVHQNTFTAIVSDDDGNSDSDSAKATVSFTDVPSSIEVIKTASPASLPEPGGLINFTVKVKNTSPIDTVTLNSLNDTLVGNLNGKGNCSIPQTIIPGNQYQCTFTGNVSGTEGQKKTSTTTAGAKDDDGGNLSESGSATVTIESKILLKVFVPLLVKPGPVLLSIQNDNTGGNVTFTVIGTGVSCTVPNNQTQFCGSFPPGTYNVKAQSPCGTATTPKTYNSGSQQTRIFCR